jgi:hypothetical protein
MLVAVLDTAPNFDADLFSEQYCLEVRTHLHLDKPAPIIPTRNWRDHIFISSGEIRKTAGDYLVRYIGTSADMSLMGIIRKLERSTFLFFCAHLNALPQVDREIGVIRPPVLAEIAHQRLPEWLRDPRIWRGSSTRLAKGSW